MNKFIAGMANMFGNRTGSDISASLWQNRADLLNGNLLIAGGSFCNHGWAGNIHKHADERAECAESRRHQSSMR